MRSWLWIWFGASFLLKIRSAGECLELEVEEFIWLGHAAPFYDLENSPKELDLLVSRLPLN